ncbi:MAG: hypothetical protein ACKPKO_27270, partial [Candidatus Fonsibacter sp.]
MLLANGKLVTCAEAFKRGDFGVFDVRASITALFTAVARGPSIWRHRKPGALVPADMTTEERQAWTASVHSCVETRLLVAHGRLDGSLRRGDTDTFWQVWCSAVEEGFMDARRLSESERKPLRGHGEVRFYIPS